jgi:hypothetical protein
MRQTKKSNIFLLVAVVLAAAGAAPESGRAASYSATGTHQCRASDGSVHSCIVTGSIFGSCVEAASSLRAQDCCPSTRVCSRDAQGRETDCKRGGVSAEFSMNYCIQGVGP